MGDVKGTGPLAVKAQEGIGSFVRWLVGRTWPWPPACPGTKTLNSPAALNLHSAITPVRPTCILPVPMLCCAVFCAVQLRDVTAVMAMRLLPPLLLALAAAAVLGGPLRWPAAQVASLVGPLLVCGVAPIAPQVGF